MTVQAKFFVHKTEGTPDGTSTAAQVHMGAVCRGAENAGWAAATPCANLTMHILNQDAFAEFERGAEYLVTFERVEPPKPGDGHAADPVRTKGGALVCARCGQVPYYVPDGDWRNGTPDWSKHDEFFGA